MGCVGLGWSLREEGWLKKEKVVCKLKVGGRYGVRGEEEGMGK